MAYGGWRHGGFGLGGFVGGVLRGFFGPPPVAYYAPPPPDEYSGPGENFAPGGFAGGELGAPPPWWLRRHWHGHLPFGYGGPDVAPPALPAGERANGDAGQEPQASGWEQQAWMQRGNEQVKQIQELMHELNAAGLGNYDLGAYGPLGADGKKTGVDGVLGRYTHAAIAKFEQEHGLPTDLSPDQLMAALRQAVRAGHAAEVDKASSYDEAPPHAGPEERNPGGDFGGMRPSLIGPRPPEFGPGSISAGGGDTSLSPEQRAVLDAAASREGANYNTICGGGTFSDYSRHPHRVGFIHPDGSKSTGAGRYQMEYSTWCYYRDKYHLPDYSPASQDKAAWYDAEEHYRNHTGRDLLTDLKAHKPGTTSELASSLSHEWASALNPSFFNAVYQHSLQKYASTGGKGQSADVPVAPGQAYGSPLDTNHLFITSGYGPRARPVAGATSMHSGVDFKTLNASGVPEWGANLRAMMNGTVIAAPGADATGGKYIAIRQDDGHVALYAHTAGMDDMGLVPGQRVRQGQVIGHTAPTGVYSGPHSYVKLLSPDGEVADILPHLAANPNIHLSGDLRPWPGTQFAGHGRGVHVARGEPIKPSAVPVSIAQNEERTRPVG